MTVPFIDLKRFEDGFLERWKEKVAELSYEARFIGGPEVEQFEALLSSENAVNHAIGCANGTDALQLALRAAGVKKDDTVLLPDSTFWATFEAIVNVGANPVTVDINRTDLQLDYDLFVKACESYKPEAAILVHLYGWGSARIDDFRSYCKQNNIKLIEDGAQAYGVSHNGKSIYSEALISTISFYPAKVFGAAGDAGAVLTNDDDLARQVRSLGNHGRQEHYAHGLVGWNSRLSSLQAAYLRISHDYLSARIQSRREAALYYQQRLPEIGVQCVLPPSGYTENGYLNVTLHESELRSRLTDVLKEKNIGFGIVYPGAMSDQKGAEPYLKASDGATNARWLAGSVLNLPIFPYIKKEEQDEVISVLKSAL